MREEALCLVGRGVFPIMTSAWHDRQFGWDALRAQRIVEDLALTPSHRSVRIPMSDQEGCVPIARVDVGDRIRELHDLSRALIEDAPQNGALRVCRRVVNQTARHLKTLSGLTPYEYIAKIWTSEPNRFIVNPIHQMPGLNT